eukprot:814724-Amphidinium_carterae.1
MGFASGFLIAAGGLKLSIAKLLVPLSNLPEARMDSLQTEKSVVRSKLQAFQERFVTEYDRKIRFHKDALTPITFA